MIKMFINNEEVVSQNEFTINDINAKVYEQQDVLPMFDNINYDYIDIRVNTLEMFMTYIITTHNTVPKNAKSKFQQYT